MENNKLQKVRIIDLAQYQAPVISESKKNEWVEYGAKNDYYEYLIDRYTYSSTNNAVINNIVKLIYGKGLASLDASRKVNEYAMLMNMISPKCIKKVITDLKMLGQASFQVIKSKDRKMIAKAYHIPQHLLRPEKCNKDGEIEAYYYSDNWQDIKNFPPKRIPAYGTSKDEIEIYCIKPYSVGMKYFSMVDYQGSLPYALLEQEISDYLINEVQNGFSGTKIINFNNAVPSDEEMDDVERRVTDKLTGSKGKRVIVSFNDDEKFKTTVDDIPLNDAPQHYEYLSDECTRKILLGHNVTSPLLFGISSTNGFSSNADELQNSFILYYNMVIKPYQDLILEAIEELLEYNGVVLRLYFDTLKPLEFAGVSSEKEAVDDNNNQLLSSDIDTLVSNSLIELGTYPKDNWILIDEFSVDYENDDIHTQELSSLNDKTTLLQKVVNLVTQGTARPNAKSEQDDIVNGFKFITRYKYEGPKDSKSREFCKKMLDADKIYRKEDIVKMESVAVNPNWGPRGTDLYDIWKFKGGGSCRHIWKKQVWVAFDEKSGIDVYNPNAIKVAVSKAEKAGYKVVNPKYVSQRPTDMPYNGFLPSNKRFK